MSVSKFGNRLPRLRMIGLQHIDPPLRVIPARLGRPARALEPLRRIAQECPKRCVDEAGSAHCERVIASCPNSLINDGGRMTLRVDQLRQRKPLQCGDRRHRLASIQQACELAARPVMIHGIEIDAYDFPMLSLRVHCGKGTYIRSLARDLGMALGTGGHCRSIRRTQVGPYLIDAAVSMDALPERVTQAMLLPVPP